MLKNLTKIWTKLVELRSDEKGLALTEYLILLGLLTGAVIAAVLLFGTELGANWNEWAVWMQTTDLGAPGS